MNRDVFTEGMGIYIHIPFCIRKCKYCDFLSFPGDAAAMDEYLEALLHEIDADEFICKGTFVNTIYFGGGTPSVFGWERLHQILCKLKSSFSIKDDAEITVEINPGTVNETELFKLRESGFNRVSVGVQSFNDAELAALGRIHDGSAAISVIEGARRAGFENISLDLMRGIPKQNMESLRNNLEMAVRLGVDHISCYSLIVEEGTEFFDLYSEKQPVDEDTLDEMDLLCDEYLEKNGYFKYEISNYAKRGMESAHNTSYWRRSLYRGFGLGSASLVSVDKKDVRLTNEGSLKDYILSSDRKYSDRKKADCSCLSIEDEMSEFVFLGLRLVCGINSSEFFFRFNREIEEIFGTVIQKYLSLGLLIKDNNTDGSRSYYFSRRGMELSNPILAEFLLA